MPFIMPDGGSDVTSVNDMKGQVILDARDVGAVANILDSCGGIQVGTINERPTSANENVLYVVTDVEPNRFYRYDKSSSAWELIGGENGGGGSAPTDIIALDVTFNNEGTLLESSNVQDVIRELNTMIKNKELDLIDSIEGLQEQVELISGTINWKSF